MIEIRNLTKSYGDKRAVDDLTVTIRSGVVTGFLGPNGAGKSTTMRMVLGLTRPDHGEALVNGRRYAELPAPLHQSAPCSTPAPCIPDGPPTPTCCRWP
jgi:ABC-2 type transport system ATP-binding protein